MKKLLLMLSVILGITLTGCNIGSAEDDVVTTLSEEELKDLIEELIPEVEQEITVDTTYDLLSFEQAINDMIDEVKTGVLGLYVDKDSGTSTGSAVVYKHDGNNYYLVTNEHVVSDANSISVVYEKNGLLFEVNNEFTTLLGADPTTDLAVVMFQSEEEFTVLEFADSYQTELGDFVFAIGNPLGFDYYGTVTMGVISGLSRYVNEDTEGGFDATLLQHDAAISPGNSGGALVNTNGQIVGINNMKIVDEDVTSIGFAIPSNTVQRIVTDLEDDGVVTSPYLGISTYPQVNVCGLDYGVCIDVIAGYAAEKGGLQDGDVIVGYKNEGSEVFVEILNFNDLREAILNSQVGETVYVKYVRDGNETTSDAIVLTEKP